MLRRIGCRRRLWARTRTAWLGGSIIALLLFITALARYRGPTDKFEFGATVTFAVGLFAIIQWRAALQQKAAEDYQAGIQGTSKDKSEQWYALQTLLTKHYAVPGGGRITERGDSDKLTFQQTAYVYQALDNLEFALEKYELGFTPAYNAMREVLTFHSKCECEPFAARAEFCLAAAYYSPLVRRAYTAIMRDVHASAATTPDTREVEPVSGKST